MREIKFRGKRKDNGEWVYGYYCQIENDHCIIPIDNEWHHEGRGDFIGDYEVVVPETVGQFTGLKDKNGKELDWWEGDLFDILGTLRQIVLEDGCFWFKAIDKTAAQRRLICFTTMYATNIFPRKIGNIYENPELLK